MSKLLEAEHDIKEHLRSIAAIAQLPRSQLVHTNNCTVPPRKDEDSLSGSLSCMQRIRKWIESQNVILASNPLCWRYFKSTTAIEQEKERQIKLNYWYIMHPFSRTDVIFGIWQLILYAVVLFLKPLNAAFPFRLQEHLTGIATITDLLCWMTIILTFFNGYVVQDTRTIVLEPKAIAWRYVSSIYFICDVLSSIPVFPTVHLCQYFWGFRHSVGLGVLYLLCELKLVRIVTVLQFIDITSDFCQVKSKANVFLILCLVVLLFTIHNCAMLFLFVPKIYRWYFNMAANPTDIWYIKYELDKDTLIRLYIHCIFRSSAYLLGIRVDLYIVAKQEEMYVLLIIIYTIGKFVICTTWVILAVTILNSRIMEIKFYSIINQLEAYMEQKQLPPDLRRRIKKYYNFKYKGKYFKENMIHDLLSPKLKKEVNLFMCRSLIASVSLFSDLTPSQVGDIVELLIPEIFLPKDTIIQSGSSGDRMYFISTGTVAVYTHSGKEVCHLQDGAYFGEICLVLKSPYRCATIIAIEITQVYTLRKHDFEKSLLKDQKMMNRMRKIAKKRLKNTLKTEENYKRMLFEQVHGGQT